MSKFESFLFTSKWAAMIINAQLMSSPFRITELVEQILLSRTITHAERRHLMSVLSAQGLLDEEEQVRIKRVLYGIRHGLLKVTE